MKLQTTLPLSIAALSLAMLLSASAQTADQYGSMQGSTSSQSANMPPSGMGEAMRMVPARAALNRSLNADKAKPGEDFRAILAKKVQLDNGPLLPKGTVLIGKITTDDMNESGASKLALRFTQAKLKDGQVIPIKATIVGVYQPESANSSDDPISPGDQVPNSWSDRILQVDQIGVLSGVDLHSKIGSMNSGVLVSTKKHNMKLDSGTEFALAIAEQHRHMKGMNQMSGMSGNNSGN